MGYELHITRAANWAENQGDYIHADVWLSLVEADAELTLNIRNGPYFAMWSGPSDHEQPWFDWSGGNIYAKYPDQKMLGKMLQIANRVGAKVQGDDGELYESMDDHPGSLPIRETKFSIEPRMPAYQRRELLWNLVTYGTIVVVIVAANLLDLW